MRRRSARENGAAKDARETRVPGRPDEPGYDFFHRGIGTRMYEYAAAAVAVGAALYLTTLYHFLFFHTLVEFFTIVVASGIFAITWNAGQFLKNDHLRFIGMAYLFVACIDLLHAMTYKGMPVFQEYGPNLPTQLWVLARFLGSGALLLAPAFFHRPLRQEWTLAILTAITALSLYAIFRGDIFPVCYVEDQGLTTFKVVSEYVICGMLLMSIVGLFKHRDRFEPEVLRLVLWSIVVTIGSELTFTLYTGLYGLPNLVGHYLKLVSFYLMYRAIITTGFTQPFSLMLRELKNEQDQLRESEQKFRQLAENIRDVFWLRDTEEPGRILYVSPAFPAVWGVKAQDAYDNPGLLWELVHPEDRAMVRSAFSSFIRGNGDYDLEYRIVRPDTATRWVRDRGFALLDAENRVHRAAGITQDVTQLKLDRQREAQLVQEIRDFAYVVSHDLRSPLVNLAGFAVELKAAIEQVTPAVEVGMPLLPTQTHSAAATALSVDIPECMEFISNAVTRMDRLIAAILNLSRIGYRELEPERLSTRDLVHGALADLGYQISQQGVTVTVGDLPEIIADRLAMEQIFSNLLTNAVDYLDPERPGVIRVTGERLRFETIFRVQDNGIGIAADDLERIFQVFQRGGAHSVSGEGMGLAYVRTLVRRHGGRIWCESEPGSGSTFVFTISHEIPAHTAAAQSG